MRMNPETLVVTTWEEKFSLRGIVQLGDWKPGSPESLLENETHLAEGRDKRWRKTKRQLLMIWFEGLWIWGRSQSWTFQLHKPKNHPSLSFLA